MRYFRLLIVVVLVGACTGSTAPGQSIKLDVGDDSSPDLITPSPDDGKPMDTGSEDVDPGVFVPVPCTENTDCDSGWCVETAEGKMCTTNCIGTCPKDWFCGQVSSTGADVTFICLPRFVTLCMPCMEDAECAAALGSQGARCLSFGNDGSFCGAECGELGGCPEGYECVPDEEDGEDAQCVRTDGICGCSWKAIKDGATTQCSFGNEHGTCDGIRSCMNGNLSDCETPGGLPDLDGDGLFDCEDGDDDGDGVDDESDNCPVTANPQQTDTDGDDIGDACENDMDGDGDPDVSDCAPLDPEIHHAADEKCNGIDENCNGIVDEGFPDIDLDGVANCMDDDDDGDGLNDADDNCPLLSNADQADQDGDLLGNACDTDDDNDEDPDATDCAPLNGSIHHKAIETCNGVDDDCDGVADTEGADGCQDYYFNEDGDGYGQSQVKKCLCAAAPPYSAGQGGDCDDNNPAVFPGANEVCNVKDDNCDGAVDEGAALGCQDAWANGDGDNFGAGPALCVCPGTPGYAQQSGDCDDDDANTHPNGLETCDGKDNNCNGLTDEENAVGCKTYFQDEDQDNFGKATVQACLCAPDGNFSALAGGDCDDDDADRFPGNNEVCDAKDNNCNGQVDEGVLETWFIDEDEDGWGATYNQQEECSKPDGFVAKAGDCNDFNGAINPSQAEQCNEIDDDCDGQEDNGLATQTSYKDNDGDGFAAKNAASLTKCDVPVGWALPQDPDNNGAYDWDCDDSDVTVNPGAPNLCGDGKDNDCDGYIDRLCYSACEGNWPFQQSYSQPSTVRAVDLDGDDNFEITVGHSFGFAILNNDGSTLYDHSAPVNNYSRRPPVFADIDSYDQHGPARQTLEVLTGNGSRPRFYRLNPATGIELIENTEVSVYDASQFQAYDLNFDGAPEFITTTWCKPEAAVRFFRFDRDENKIVHVNDIADGDSTCVYTDQRVLTDLDGDGIMEVVYGNGYAKDTHPQHWGGHIFAEKFTDLETLATTSHCAPGTCFNMDIPGLFGSATRYLMRIGDEFRVHSHYFMTNIPQQANVSTNRWWRFDLQGNVLEGPTETDTTFWSDVTDINDDGTPESRAEARWPGLFDVNGDGFPDRLRSTGTSLIVDLWDEGKKTFLHQEGSKLSISDDGVSLQAIWDIDGDGRVEVLSRDAVGRVFCHKMGEDTWNKLSSLPPHDTNAYRTGQWDNYEPNDGADTSGDAIPDRIARIPSALTATGNFYSYLSHADDEDYYLVDTNWGGNLCLRSPKDRTYTLHVYSYLDRWNNQTQAPGKDGKPDALIWENTGDAANKCFSGNKVAPHRHGEYRFVVGIKGKDGDHSPYWPYWITAKK